MNGTLLTLAALLPLAVGALTVEFAAAAAKAA